MVNDLVAKLNKKTIKSHKNGTKIMVPLKKMPKK